LSRTKSHSVNRGFDRGKRNGLETGRPVWIPRLVAAFGLPVAYEGLLDLVTFAVCAGPGDRGAARAQPGPAGGPRIPRYNVAW